MCSQQGCVNYRIREEKCHPMHSVLRRKEWSNNAQHFSRWTVEQTKSYIKYSVVKLKVCLKRPSVERKRKSQDSATHTILIQNCSNE